MTEETAKKPRKPRCDKGVPRPKPEALPRIPDLAPVHVKLLLKGETEYVEFGCTDRTVSGGFHVFFYPSERDRYRETRREVAISEVKDIQITEAPRREREVFDLRPPKREEVPIEEPVPIQTGPRIHSPRRGRVMEALESSEGPIALQELPPGMTFTEHVG